VATGAEAQAAAMEADSKDAAAVTAVVAVMKAAAMAAATGTVEVGKLTAVMPHVHHRRRSSAARGTCSVVQGSIRCQALAPPRRTSPLPRTVRS